MFLILLLAGVAWGDTPNQSKIVEAIQNLNAPKWRDRESASNLLKTLPTDEVTPHLDIAKNHSDPETRKRANSLLVSLYPVLQQKEIVKKILQIIRKSDFFEEPREAITEIHQCIKVEWDKKNKEATDYINKGENKYFSQRINESHKKLSDTFAELTKKCEGVESVKLLEAKSDVPISNFIYKSGIESIKLLQTKSDVSNFEIIYRNETIKVKHSTGLYSFSWDITNKIKIEFDELLPPFFSDEAGKRFQRINNQVIEIKMQGAWTPAYGNHRGYNTTSEQLGETYVHEHQIINANHAWFFFEKAIIKFYPTLYLAIRYY